MTILPENILRAMSPKDRAKLGKAGRTNSECSEIQLAKRESEVQKEINNWLRLHDIFVFWSRTDKRTRGKKGTPDHAFAWRMEKGQPPYPVAVEVKVGDNKSSDEQIKVAKQMIANGWAYLTVSSLAHMLECLAVTITETKGEE